MGLAARSGGGRVVLLDTGVGWVRVLAVSGIFTRPQSSLEVTSESEQESSITILYGCVIGFNLFFSITVNFHLIV